MANKKEKTKKNRNIGLILKVSAFWILLAVVVVGFIQWGQMNYNRGTYDGIEKTRNILQGK